MLLLLLLPILHSLHAQELTPPSPSPLRLDVQCVATNNLLFVGHHPPNENILVVRLLDDSDNDFSSDQMICVRSNDNLHADVCSPIQAFYYPFSSLSNHGFGIHSLSVFLASSSVEAAATLDTIELEINVADALYSDTTTTTKTSIE